MSRQAMGILADERPEMKLSIADIGEEGRRLQRELSAAEVRELLGSTGVETQPEDGGASIDLELTRVQETVFVRGAISGSFSIACSRCLEPARIELQEPRLRLTFLPPLEPAGGELELEQDDLDTFTHDGEQIDIGALLREYLVLAIPIAPLCREECDGIEAPEGLTTEEGPAWKAALRRIRVAGSSGDKPGESP